MFRECVNCAAQHNWNIIGYTLLRIVKIVRKIFLAIHTLYDTPNFHVVNLIVIFLFIKSYRKNITMRAIYQPALSTKATNHQVATMLATILAMLV